MKYYKMCFLQIQYYKYNITIQYYKMCFFISWKARFCNRSVWHLQWLAFGLLLFSQTVLLHRVGMGRRGKKKQNKTKEEKDALKPLKAKRLMFLGQNLHSTSVTFLDFVLPSLKIVLFTCMVLWGMPSVALKANLHSTTLSHAICLRQVLDTSCFV